MGEIKERLRALATQTGYGDPLAAIDLIDSLEKQRDEAKLKVERLVKALKPFAEILEGFYPGAKDDDLLADADHAITVGDLREACAAIKEAGKP